jgi:hypothetical protein
MALVGQALVPRGRSWAVRIISLSAGLFGVVVLAAYTANLAAILTDTSASTAISRCKHLPQQLSLLIMLERCFSSVQYTDMCQRLHAALGLSFSTLAGCWVLCF